MTAELTQLATAVDLDAERLQREWRGKVYLARLRLNRLEGAWPDPRQRNDHQANAIRQQRTILAATILAARREGVALIWRPMP